MEVIKCYSRILNAINDRKDIIIVREKDYKRVLEYVMSKDIKYVECSSIYEGKLLGSGITEDVRVLRRCVEEK